MAGPILGSSYFLVWPGSAGTAATADGWVWTATVFFSNPVRPGDVLPLADFGTASSAVTAGAASPAGGGSMGGGGGASDGGGRRHHHHVWGV